MNEEQNERQSEEQPKVSGAQGQGTRGARVLVIDDEPEIRRAVRAGLASAEFAVEWAPTGTQGMEMVAQWHPDVVLLDLSLPDIDGIEVCRQLRTWSQTPIIVLSVRSGDADKIAALELGADDYLTKPFSMGELIARIRVALRHAAHSATGGGTAEARFATGELALDFGRRRVTMGGAEVHLTPTEYEVLKYLAMNAGRVITHHTLLRAVWGPQYEDEAHYLRVFIGQLRRKIEPEPSRPRYLLTEPGIGYRLRVPE
ncbi:MAG: DNA-binding response regulator KdpE [Ktedonobacterales bacterium]|jgi:two-component system KDP operon response regulator KdpE|nr:MAG: DNA-binding response regulator KdpE [Ktedonobacterales bacterium]